MIDLLITNASIITMDPERRVLENSAIAVDAGKILEVGDSADLEKKYSAKRVISAEKSVVMPGLIDSHQHSGHAMIKTLGDGDDDKWYVACQEIYLRGSDEEFWAADAYLTGAERLMNGITTSLSYFGGGDAITRADDPKYAEAHLKAIDKVGIREVLAMGPCRPQFPTMFAEWNGDEKKDVPASFERQMAVTEELIQTHNHQGRTSICLTFPVYGHRKEFWGILDEVRREADAVMELKHKYNTLLTQDGHRRGTIQYEYDQLGFTDPGNIYSHSINLTDEEIELCAKTGTVIVHNPSAAISISGRCPVPELLDAGGLVVLGSDAYAPDRGSDMLRHVFHGMHYTRTAFHDSNMLPAGKMLEMITIDAAKGLGMEKEIGSIEPGKKADLIIIDLRKPHLYPLNMIPVRVASYASGADVDTVIVDGEILMEHRKLLTVDLDSVLDKAQEAADKAMSRTGVSSFTALQKSFWGCSHY